MSYQLFYSPGSCSMAVHIALLETGQKVELIDASISAGKNKSPEMLKMNPRGQVPVLVVDGKPLREGAAILTYVCEAHKSRLLPASGWERAKAQEWLAFANSTLHPAYSRVFFLMKNNAADSPLMDMTLAYIQKLWDEVESELQTKPYLVGQEITIADILVSVIANWSVRMPKPIAFGAKTKDLFKRVTARPSFQQAMAIEHIEYKVAA